jgi:hypothetical protein
MKYVFTFSHREPSNQKLKENSQLTFPTGVIPYAPSIHEIVNYPLASGFNFRGRVLEREVTFQVNAEGEPEPIRISFEMERTIDPEQT